MLIGVACWSETMNVVDFATEQRFLERMYDESGRQIRANEQLLTAYLAFAGAILAALIVLPQASASIVGVWALASGASVMGLGMALTSGYFITRAVYRQRTITRGAVSSAAYRAIAPESKWAMPVRLFRPYAWALVFLVLSVFCLFGMIWGEPDWVRAARLL